ncbi:MAG: hypothetical protein LBR07_06130, partial [Puniceicoccales bacterium]|nr:hypothetical protein [Puniceicoccales bacterium]
MELVPSADTDLPAPLTHAFRATTLGKTTPRRWLSAAEYAAYLRAGGAAGADIAAAPDPELYDAERAIGIGIDPETLATESGKFYSAEYLRLRPGVALALAASCDLQPKGAAGTTVDVFQKLPLPHDLIIGGQQGVATLAAAAGADDLLPAPPAIPAGATRLRWTLLTPAIFPALDNHLGGWLPTWIDAATGSVLLKTGDTARRVLAGGRPEPRDAWRARVQQLPAINARLIAARVGKPEAVTGWDLLEKSPKPTLLAVPAGSAYVFDCATGADALALAAALNPPNRRSTLLGEKGYGLGLCAPWQDAGTAQSSPSGGVHAA